MAVYKDSSIEIQTLQRQANARQTDSSTLVSGASLSLIKKYNDNTLDYIDKQKNSQLFKDIINIMQTAGKGASNIYSSVKDFQAEKAQRDLNLMSEEYNTVLEQSIMDGSTYFDVDENGNQKLVLSNSVLNLQYKQRKYIKDSNYLPEVKKNMLGAFEYNNKAANVNAYSTAYKQSYAEMQEAFSYNIGQAAIKDSQTIVSYGGDFNKMLSDGVILAGTQVIEGNSYLTPGQKQQKITEYITDIRKQGDIDTSITIARNQGAKAAYDYIYDQNRTYLTEQEKQSIYSTALKSLSQSVSLASEEASGYMRDAMIKFANGDSSVTARDIYSQLAKSYANAPKEIQQAVMDSAHTEQVKALNEMITTTYNVDSINGYDSLITRYKELENGVYDDYFTNAESLKAAAMYKYKSSIDEIETKTAKELQVSKDAIKTANTALIKEYNSALDNIFANVENGTITPSDAVSEIATVQSIYSARVQGNKDDLSVSLTSSIINTAATTLVNKLCDDYIPANIKTYAKNKFEILLAQINMPYSTSKRTADEEQLAQNLEKQYYSQVAEYIYQNGANLTRDEVDAFCSDIASNLAADILNGSFEDIYNGTMLDAPSEVSSASKAKKDALSFIDTAYNTSNLVYNDSSQKDKTGEAISYKWISSEAKDQAEYAAGWTATQISYITKEEPANIATSWVPTRVDGSVVAVPQVTSAGYAWRIGPSGDIEYYDNGTWIDTNIKPDTTAEKIQKQLDDANISKEVKANIIKQTNVTVSPDTYLTQNQDANKANIISGQITGKPFQIVLTEEQQKEIENSKILATPEYEQDLRIIEKANNKNVLLNIKNNLIEKYNGTLPDEILSAINSKGKSLKR